MTAQNIQNLLDLLKQRTSLSNCKVAFSKDDFAFKATGIFGKECACTYFQAILINNEWRIVYSD